MYLVGQFLLLASKRSAKCSGGFRSNAATDYSAGTRPLTNKVMPTVGYVSDAEGNIDYWNRYVQFSSVVDRGNDGKLVLRDNCQLVYGGDVCDRGRGDIRILKDLVDLKDTFPDRVHFILGNRDVNKLRLPFALHPSVLRKPASTYWSNKGTETLGYTDKMKWVS